MTQLGVASCRQVDQVTVIAIRHCHVCGRRELLYVEAVLAADQSVTIAQQLDATPRT